MEYIEGQTVEIAWKQATQTEREKRAEVGGVGEESKSDG